MMLATRVLAAAQPSNMHFAARARKRGLWVAAVVAALELAACSLLGLGDSDIPTCTESAAGHSRCQLLDDRNHIPASACYHWQCRRDGRPGCELAPKDYDGDGRPDELACKELEAVRNLDCDDTRAERYNDNVETCDGFDNNCNGVVDEGSLDDRAQSQDAGWLDRTVFSDKPVELALVAQQAPQSISKPLLSMVTNRGGWLLDPIAETAVAIHYESALAIEPNPKPCPRSNASSVLCNMHQSVSHCCYTADATYNRNAAVVRRIGARCANDLRSS
jgi:hypothetical protein